MGAGEVTRGVRRRWPCAASAIVLATVLAGCGDGGQSEVTRGPYTIYVHDDSLFPRGGNDALVGGTLITRGGCVLVGDENGAVYPVVWPSGTSIVDDDPLTLELGSGDQLTVGASVSGGGGTIDPAEGSGSEVKVDIAQDCRSASGEVVVFNPDADVDVKS